MNEAGLCGGLGSLHVSIADGSMPASFSRTNRHYTEACKVTCMTWGIKWVSHILRHLLSHCFPVICPLWKTHCLSVSLSVYDVFLFSLQ